MCKGDSCDLYDLVQLLDRTYHYFAEPIKRMRSGLNNGEGVQVLWLVRKMVGVQVVRLVRNMVEGEGGCTFSNPASRNK